jgi:hypothetical protein
MRIAEKPSVLVFLTFEGSHVDSSLPLFESIDLSCTTARDCPPSPFCSFHKQNRQLPVASDYIARRGINESSQSGA